jgi:hypothetical protein
VFALLRGKNALEAASEDAARQQHAPSTTGAAQSDVGPYAVDHPYIAAAGVLLAHLNVVAHTNILHGNFLRA